MFVIVRYVPRKRVARRACEVETIDMVIVRSVLDESAIGKAEEVETIATPTAVRRVFAESNAGRVVKNEATGKVVIRLVHREIAVGRTVKEEATATVAVHSVTAECVVGRVGDVETIASITVALSVPEESVAGRVAKEEASEGNAVGRVPNEYVIR